MNSEENNEQQIKKLERLERIYTDEERHESVMDKIEMQDEDICAPARKVFRWALPLSWLLCVVTITTGGDFSLAAAGVLFSGGIFAGLCVTKFLRKNKKGDAVVSALITVATIALGIVLLAGNTPY